MFFGFVAFCSGSLSFLPVFVFLVFSVPLFFVSGNATLFFKSCFDYLSVLRIGAFACVLTFLSVSLFVCLFVCLFVFMFVCMGACLCLCVCGAGVWVCVVLYGVR